MDGYPVFELTLKSAKQEDYDTAYYMIENAVIMEFERHRDVVERGKERLSSREYEWYTAIADGKAEEKNIRNSLQLFCQCMYKITEKNTVILIDEYDVPLENAYFRGFYEKMVGFIRSFFEAALKTNQYLQFAVITGCLRISKERYSRFMIRNIWMNYGKKDIGRWIVMEYRSSGKIVKFGLAVNTRLLFFTVREGTKEILAPPSLHVRQLTIWIIPI